MALHHMEVQWLHYYTLESFPFGSNHELASFLLELFHHPMNGIDSEHLHLANSETKLNRYFDHCRSN